MSSLLEVSQLHKSYADNTALDGVSFDVSKQEVLAIIGPSGSGKTTLLRILGMLDRPTSGSVRFDGEDMLPSNSRRLQLQRRISFVFQKPTVFSASVFENVAYGLKVRKLEREFIRGEVLGVLETVGLEGYENRDARTLSGGEVQRVALARAIVTRPELLLLDEPTANLDVGLTRQIEELLSQVIEQLQTTVIMATHDFAQGKRLANRLGVLIQGEMLQMGDPDEVFSRPNSPEVARFVELTG